MKNYGQRFMTAQEAVIKTIPRKKKCKMSNWLSEEALQIAEKEEKLKQRRKGRSEVKSLSHIRLFVTPWTVAYQVPPSVGFSRKEYWIGLPFPSPGDLPHPGVEPGLPHCRQTHYHLSHQGMQSSKE